MHSQLKPRILAIDDEPSIGVFLRSVLERTGNYRLEVETDPFAAIAKARMFKPDLVIIDLNMPGRSGLEVAAMIRKEPWLRHRPILFFTCIANTEADALRAGAEGPAAFLMKGVQVGAIVETVDRLVAERLELYRAFTSSCSMRGAAA